MNILTIAGPLHKEFGGPPMAATGVASSLAKLGHQVKMLVCGQSNRDVQTNSVFFDKLKESRVEVQVIGRRYESVYGTAIKFSEIAALWSDVRKADFIILHQVFALQFIITFPILVLSRKPYAVMPHGSLTNYQRKQHKLRKFLAYPGTYSFLKLAKAIFVATEQERSQLPKFLQKKGKVVGLGIDIPNLYSEKLVKSTLSFNLLFMGRIARKKRLDIALQAFALASKKSTIEMKFIVCGSGEEHEMAQLRKLVATLQIDSEVEFRGWVDFFDKQRAFLESDCFILTSEDENFAVAAAEALSYGIPCILSSNVALSNLVMKHNAGVVLNELNYSEIEMAISKIASLNKDIMKNSSLRAASEIGWESIAKKWEECIMEILQDPQDRPSSMNCL